MKNVKRMRIPFFAPWAVISAPFSKEKHYIENDAICYDVKPNECYANHIEMAGKYCASIISYGVDKKANLRIMRHAVYPTLRNYPNNTHSSLDFNFKQYTLFINNEKQTEKVEKFIFDGVLKIVSRCDGLTIIRTIYPTSTKLALCENLEICNPTQSQKKLKIKLPKPKITSPKYGQNYQSFKFNINCDKQSLVLESKQTVLISLSYCASVFCDSVDVDNKFELEQRLNFLSEMKSKLIVNTPNPQINLMTYYAKIRAAESIFVTKGGLMHSPGGGGYYAAIWTNDQCEYVNPLFGYLGYELGVAQAKNCYDLYKKYISSDRSLITSIIAEGDGTWHGAKDRGDSAMYAYGASRFLLTLGDKESVYSYIDYIDKCLEYTLSQTNGDGVIASDSDELEGRFLTGKANLCTSCIAYDALMSAGYLHKEIGNSEKSTSYFEKAEKLACAINAYFSKNIEGFDTYMYCKEETHLRSWIAVPLVVGIFDKAENTKNALLSDKLRVKEGLLTRSGEKTFWDRSTLYTLRGLFNADFSDQANELLKVYTQSRLLGEHIPYAVEAFPEGNQAQLSAESGLYLRIFVEGVLGFRPTGLGKFVLNPHIPEEWDFFELDNLLIVGKKIKITVDKARKIQVLNKETNEVSTVDKNVEITV